MDETVSLFSSLDMKLSRRIAAVKDSALISTVNSTNLYSDFDSELRY